MASSKQNEENNEAIFKVIVFGVIACVFVIFLPVVIFGFILWLLLFKIFKVIIGRGYLVFLTYLVIGIVFLIWDFVVGTYSFKLMLTDDIQVIKDIFNYEDYSGIWLVMSFYWKSN